MYNIFNNNLFNNDIEIVSQYVKIIHLQTPLGADINLNSESLELHCIYDIMNNKEDIRNHIVLLEFCVTEKNSNIEELGSNITLSIVVEGIYNISTNIAEKNIEYVKHTGSLNLLINYLRTVFFNITSLTANGGQFLPLMNINELHLKRDEVIKKMTNN